MPKDSHEYFGSKLNTKLSYLEDIKLESVSEMRFSTAFSKENLSFGSFLGSDSQSPTLKNNLEIFEPGHDFSHYDIAIDNNFKIVILIYQICLNLRSKEISHR